MPVLNKTLLMIYLFRKSLTLVVICYLFVISIIKHFLTVLTGVNDIIGVQIQMSDGSAQILNEIGGFNFTSRGIVHLPKVFLYRKTKCSKKQCFKNC